MLCIIMTVIFFPGIFLYCSLSSNSLVGIIGEVGFLAPLFGYLQTRLRISTADRDPALAAALRAEASSLECRSASCVSETLFPPLKAVFHLF